MASTFFCYNLIFSLFLKEKKRDKKKSYIKTTNSVSPKFLTAFITFMQFTQKPLTHAHVTKSPSPSPKDLFGFLIPLNFLFLQPMAKISDFIPISIPRSFQILLKCKFPSGKDFWLIHCSNTPKTVPKDSINTKKLNLGTRGLKFEKSCCKNYRFRPRYGKRQGDPGASPPHPWRWRRPFSKVTLPMNKIKGPGGGTTPQRSPRQWKERVTDTALPPKPRRAVCTANKTRAFRTHCPRPLKPSPRQPQITESLPGAAGAQGSRESVKSAACVLETQPAGGRPAPRETHPLNAIVPGSSFRTGANGLPPPSGELTWFLVCNDL